MGLLRPLIITHFLNQPPELKRLYRIARAVDHVHVAVQVGHIEIMLVIIHLARAEKQTRRRVNTEELMSADGDGFEMLILAAHHLPVLRERQIAAEQRRIDMPVYGHLRMFGQHRIQCLHVVDRTLEGRAHRIHHQRRTLCIQGFFQLLRNHTPHRIALNQLHLQMLQIAQTHVRVVRLVAHVHGRHTSRTVVQIVGAEIDTVVVAVGTAVCYDAPHVVLVKTV